MFGVVVAPFLVAEKSEALANTRARLFLNFAPTACLARFYGSKRSIRKVNCGSFDMFQLAGWFDMSVVEYIGWSIQQHPCG
jgi:hypothetical protein